MANSTYDIISIGGGLGGSALAKNMAEKGAKVLVLESETRFRDRIRGEVIVSWGVLEAQKLGIYEGMKAAGAREIDWEERTAGVSTEINLPVERNLSSTTSIGTPKLTFYHPQIQEAILQLASDSGAQVHRGAIVTGVRKDGLPRVTANINGRDQEFTSRLVVGADGRSSGTRNWGGFESQSRQAVTFCAGVLFDDMRSPDDRSQHYRVYDRGMVSLLFPQGDRRVRAYLCYPQAWGMRLSGSDSIKQFIDWSAVAGTPSEYFAGATPTGTLASFDSSTNWINHPYRNNIVLIGDAAGATDPMFGQGVSLTFRDARVLCDQLLDNEDWDIAGHEYAEQHDKYFGVCITVQEWNDRLLTETGEKADARREKAFSSWRTDPSRRLDTGHSGPNHPVDETVRRRFFGEE
jgi:2-polyprenyl-6-methoxyphenol hydroxylase-like FAD-dependent oxidoreductase